MQIKQPNAELLNTQLNAEEQKESKENSSENKKMIERIPLEGTPFTMLRVEKECFGALGKYRITDMYNTIPEVEEKLIKKDWDTIMIVATIVALEEVYKNEGIRKGH